MVGALSVISAITRIFSIGIYGFFEDMVGFYRGLLKPLFDLFEIFDIHLSALQADLLLAYLVLLMMSLRAGLFPLARPEIFDSERHRIATIQEEVGTFTPETAPSNVIYAKMRPDGSYLIRSYRYKPNAYLYARSAISCFLLLPILTLLPFRRAIPSVGSKGTWNSLRLLWVAIKISEKDEKAGFIERVVDGQTKSAYSVNYLKTCRAYALVAAQAAALPFAVVLFFALAKAST